MTRHAKNVTAGNVYTNHERKKDAKESGYGSLSLRLSKDSIQVHSWMFMDMVVSKFLLLTY